MATLRRKGRYFYVRERSGGVDTETATGCTDRKAAEAFLREWERDRAEPERAARRAARAATVQQAVDLAMARHRAENRAGNLAADTVAFYERKLGVVLSTLGAETPLAEVTAGTIDAYVSQRRDEGAKDHTIHKELGALSFALALSRRAGIFDRLPEDVMPVRFAPRYEPNTRALSVAEVQLVIAVLQPDRAAWVALAVGAGAELAALQRAERGDYDPKAGLVRVRGTKTDRRDREVPVVLPECRALVELAFARGQGTKPLLLRPWHMNWRDLKLAAEKVAIAAFSLHSLRHTFATWHLAAGVSWDDTARALGHANTAMLHRTYGNLSASQLRSRLAGVLAPAGDFPVSSPPEGGTGVTGGTGGPSETPLLPGISVPRDGIEPPTRGFSVPPTSRPIPLFIPQAERLPRSPRVATSPDVPRSGRRATSAG